MYNMDFNRDRVNRLISRNTKILVGIFILTLIAGVLQAVGYATPGWLVFSGTDQENVTFSAGIGFWYQRICTDSCDIGHTGSAFWSEDEQNEFETFKLIATVAAVISLFIPVVVAVYIRRLRLQRDITTIAGTAVLLCLGSGVLALVVVGKIASDVHTAYDLLIKTEDSDFKLGLLYSELLMGLGGALDCLAFIGLCIQLYFRKKTCGDSGGEEFVGMTSDTKQ
ncbi:uncharacterized protein LOC123546593 [Mercenaria mercenaria]|uniref:uncharacterized protein LOC123546593 n=1 Tax=Mercenaria mercenaria TaxID=6596 RepID=UPI001E1DB18E|nr:uncharacterized protein LOC123546593 [Mercenaria mercenaria]